MTKAPEMKVSPTGTRKWWLHDKLHRTDGPAVEYSDGTRAWYLYGKLHREDGPAIERADGSRVWYLHDKLHRTDGPAVELADGTREWCLHGEPMTFEQWLAQTTAELAERVMLALRWR